MALAALLLPVVASAQFSITGKITDQSGEALANATVSITNPNINTQTDGRGSYTISNLPAGTYAVKASFIGFQLATKSITLNGNQTLNFVLTNNVFTTEEVTVTATRANKTSPTAFTNLSKKDLQKNNFGQDLPYLLNQTPSVVVTSDAGAGVGYTGIRIRGSDASRVNVTINGIPYNDSESQGSFFVDLPDIASSVNNIQVQRGVGTSTNGAGAFGGSINIQTTTRRDTGYADISSSAGSFNTFKNTLNFGTGLMGGKFAVDGRLSQITSDGYIDDASSNLKSYFVSGAYYGKNNTLRANIFSGKERTFQAWNGIPDYIIGDNTIPNHRTYNELGMMDGGKRYADQVDDYLQNHYQLLYDHKLSDKVSFSGALHYTRGKGYYEEYKKNDSVSNYGLKPVNYGTDTISTTNLARRRWLDNYFYGVTYALKYNPQTNLNFTLGGAYNEYKGAHYGNIIYSEQGIGVGPNYQYYRDDAKKTDFNIFTRGEWRLGDVILNADMQYRRIYYSFLGYDRNLNNVQQNATLNFFNPKAGITYVFNENSNVYASYAVGNHEPNRDDYTNSSPNSRPKPETLHDFEAGYRTAGDVFKGGINLFYMLYKNQLILTGALNDVGSPARVNVDDSYRAGIEFDGRVQATKQLSIAATATISTNKIKNYTQLLKNYDDDTRVPIFLKKTDIAYSPSFIASGEIAYAPVKGGEIALLNKYISSQYLDNTMNTNPAGLTATGDNRFVRDRLLKSYFVSDLRVRYNFAVKHVKNIALGVQVNNIFNKEYEANGATYPDIEGGQVVNYNYFFAQAKRNFMTSVTVSF
ncbi:TonB-dependent receptor [Mucilaginibacter conchicola]|uniref:TonB-dependent receptor n=1 Tax=Mucilaginibacter conchicola TaxID=2303333 RepID=A0A372NWN4_9SPHI|nr:TonB-dependent receptor [Mucilaginibacter conchicola]